jgi:predicted transcriptional regulator
MLETLLMSQNAERVLIYLAARGEGYTREIARFYSVDADSIKKQLTKFESGSVLVSSMAGKTKMYRFNPRYPFLNELLALLSKALEFYPKQEQEQLTMNRTRPRRPGKPL